MIEEIKILIKNENYSEAAELAEQEIHRIEVGDLITRLPEHYNELVGLRITANTLLKKTDDLIFYTTWKHKYPHKEKIEFSVGGSVTLTDENITFLHSDAYINSIHADKKFDYNQRSFSNTILKELGKEQISEQLTDKKQNPQKLYYVLMHPEFSAPISYNIPVVEGEGIINLEVLKEGLLNALNDSRDKGLGRISIAALGMEVNPDKTTKEKIIKVIAETLEEFFKNNRAINIPEINFPFITVSSFNAFRDVFKRYSEKGKFLSKFYIELSETQNKLREILRTNTPKLIEMIKSLSYVINENFNLLFLGESGTGKSYLAEELHKLSNRKDKPFKSLNCAQVTPDQLFTLVFGWGAHVYHDSPDGGKSIFEEADGGTVFLDEIGYTNIAFQKSLLTFLDKGKYTKPGDKTDYYSNSRLFFGTNQNLEKLVEQGLFIHDLYERLISYRYFKMLPLRDRKEDLPEIINIEKQKFNELHETEIEIDEDTMNLLVSFNWPGNYRQLINYIQKKFYDLFQERESLLTVEIINNDPPRNNFFHAENNLTKLENLFIQMLKDWDHKKNGKFLETIVKPIIAKVYLEDYKQKYNKTDSNGVIGIDGDRKDSPVEKYFQIYEETIKPKV